MRTFETSKQGDVTIVDEAHGITSRTFVPAHEVEQKRSWLGAMGYAPDVSAPASKAAKKSAPKKKAGGKR